LAKTGLLTTKCRRQHLGIRYFEKSIFVAIASFDSG
jgi:hypothetical protein